LAARVELGPFPIPEAGPESETLKPAFAAGLAPIPEGSGG